MWSYSPRPILNPLVLNINKQLDPWMKSCENQDSILKSRDITLLTKVHLVKAIVFPVVMHRCETWTIRMVSAEELMLLNSGAGESLGLQGDYTS